MEFFEKVEALKNDLSWNVPEQKLGTINVIGGNSQNFKTAIKISEFIAGVYPVQNVNTVLPDALQNNLPELPNLQFLSSTDTGSFKDAEELLKAFNTADFNLIVGDLSKNSITKKAMVEACEESEKPVLITRDAVDLIVADNPEKLLLNENIIIMASEVQLQALLRSVYYPKMLLLSQSLMQVAEILHKFTLSYPVKIITLHTDQIILAENGNVKAVPLTKSGSSPITVWNGELAAKIAALNLYNPNNFMDASLSAVLGR